MFDPEPAEGTADFIDPILDAPNLCGTHHHGASTEQAQDAIAEEAFRVVSVFMKSGEVPNCVNLAKRMPAKCQLIVRQYDRIGVLAFVLEQIRARGINFEEVQNIIFDGAAAASCRIQPWKSRRRTFSPGSRAATRTSSVSRPSRLTFGAW